MNRQGSAFTPFFWFLGIFLTFGILINLMAVGLIDLSVVNEDNSFNSFFNFLIDYFESSFIDLIETDWTIFGFQVSIPVVNIFALLPDSMSDYLVGLAVVWSYVPESIVVFFAIMFSVATALFAIKMVFP